MNELDNAYREIIRIRAEDIRKKIKGAVCYGIPMDENNIDDMIVSAYFYGYNLASGNLYDDIKS